MINNLSNAVNIFFRKFLLLISLFLIPLATSASTGNVPSVGPVRVEFIIFGLILLGVALFNKRTFLVAVAGLAVLLTFKIAFDPGFHFMEHLFRATPLGEQFWIKDCVRENGE
jgi:hypothetical protein